VKRLLWLGLGIVAGTLAARAITRKVQSYAPGTLAGSARESAGDLLGSIRGFVNDVRVGMAEREEQIHEAIQRGETIPDDALAADNAADDDLADGDPAEDKPDDRARHHPVAGRAGRVDDLDGFHHR
jgi:hypothetical protein